VDRRGSRRNLSKLIVLDMDSSVSPTHGEQEGTAYNGHTCYHPLFVLNQFGDLELCSLHPGELYPRVGFIVTNLSRHNGRLVTFYNQRETAEQYIKEGKSAVRWTHLSCQKFRNNEVRFQLHALAYNLGNFMRTLALPDAVEQRYQHGRRCQMLSGCSPSAYG
jgi:hypothetical protein